MAIDNAAWSQAMRDLSAAQDRVTTLEIELERLTRERDSAIAEIAKWARRAETAEASLAALKVAEAVEQKRIDTDALTDYRAAVERAWGM